jgi:pyrimidine operon attenuation protein / uracil phosphoribosyltransferase
VILAVFSGPMVHAFEVRATPISNSMRELLDSESVDRGLRRVAGEILERHSDASALVLIGIRRGGVPIAEEIGRWLQRLDGVAPPLGHVDITLYRDDAATAMPNPRIGPSNIPVSLDRRVVVLVDDVLYTGRTIRAALDALLDYGRPQRIELAVLVDRGGREFPIQADYVVRTVTVSMDERVDVRTTGEHTTVEAVPYSSPTIPPKSVVTT